MIGDTTTCDLTRLKARLLLTTSKTLGRGGKSMVCSRVILALVCVAGLAVLPANAIASGTIAGAPTVVFGQQEFGNTAADSQATCPALQEQNSWWLLPAQAGDRVTVDYEGSGVRQERLFPIGTNDFNYPARDANPFQQTASGGGREEATVTIPQTGVWPLEFDSWSYCGSPIGGPYDFTASVAHTVIVSLTSSGDRRHHLTVLTAKLSDPDGAPLSSTALRCTFQQFEGGKFTTVGTSLPPCHTMLRWTAHQRGKLQTLRVQVAGSGYLSASSRNIHFRAS
jgi:hypothetical protein